jgi:hypothetical protein
MLKRQHTEDTLDEGVVDLKRSRVEDMALVSVPTEESQQLMISESNNKVNRLLQKKCHMVLISTHICIRMPVFDSYAVGL